VTDFYDRQGNPITLEEWMRLSGDKIVRQDEVGDYFVSTVWLGINHNFHPIGPPLIFETMVFPSESWRDLECCRYSTEEEALEGHERMLNEVRLIVDATT
jgi:hypothetical protein